MILGVSLTTMVGIKVPTIIRSLELAHLSTGINVKRLNFLVLRAF